MLPSSFMISQMMPAGNEARQPRQIDRSLGLPGAHQHSALAGAQREHVARPRQIGRLGSGIDGYLNGSCAIVG